MKLPAVKALVPGKVMLIVLTAIGLALGWYLYTAEKNSDHLIRRNFHHLNQIGANIDASAEAIQQAILFDQRKIQRQLNDHLSKHRQSYLEKNIKIDRISDMEPLVDEYLKIYFKNWAKKARL